MPSRRADGLAAIAPITDKPMAVLTDLKKFLDAKVAEYNQPGFIADDPIAIPRGYTKKQDIEIAGFIAATLAWGQRATIINKCRQLLALMGGAPHDFVLHHAESDLVPLADFRHRTFNGTDLLYFVSFFQWYYQRHDSLEEGFAQGMGRDGDIGQGISHFHRLFCGLAHFPARTRKHVASPERKSACKRINMFLRWMVRQDEKGVDFGLWRRIRPSQLVCPCDLHVDRVARKLGLITRKQTDWQTALELTENLRQLDANDPVKYDFALFGLGVEGRW